jgi:hypothetical protein
MTNKDSLGAVIEIGDTLVYATRRGSQTYLKNAIICELGENYVKAINSGKGIIVTLANTHLRTAVVKKFMGEV